MVDISLVMIYSDDLPSSMVFSYMALSSCLHPPHHPTPKSCAPPKKQNSCWLDLLIWSCLFMEWAQDRPLNHYIYKSLRIPHRMLINRYPEATKEILFFLIHFFSVDLLGFSDWWWKWHFVLPEMHWIIFLALTGINAMLESSFKVLSFWSLSVSSSIEIKFMIGYLNWVWENSPKSNTLSLLSEKRSRAGTLTGKQRQKGSASLHWHPNAL